MRRLYRRVRAWLLKPSHDPAPYLALFFALMLTRMSGGPYDGNRRSPWL